MKKNIIIAGIIILAFAAGILLYFMVFSKTNGKNNSKTTTTIKKETTEEKAIEAYGIVKPENSYNVNIDFTATVEKFYVKEGQKVKKGERLAIIKYDEYESLVKSKELDLINTQYELKKMSAESYLEDSANYQIQKKKIDILSSELERMKNRIINKNIINNILICTIENGLVSEIGYIDGDYIFKEKKVLSIYDLDSLVIEADVPEEFIKDVKIGNIVKINPVSNKSKEYTGKVKRISNIASNKNGETVIKIYVSLDKKDDFLLPNFNVDLKIMY